MRPVDHSVVFPDQEGAETFAILVQAKGFATSIRGPDEYSEFWDVTATRPLSPTCEAITNIEFELEEMAEPYGGKNDGGHADYAAFVLRALSSSREIRRGLSGAF